MAAQSWRMGKSISYICWLNGLRLAIYTTRVVFDIGHYSVLSPKGVGEGFNQNK